MKKFSTLFSVLALLLFTFSCGDDGDDDPWDAVPSGEIVEVELRDAALSGTVNSGGRQAAVGQKWWKQKVSKLDFSGECGESEDEDLTDGNYYAFYASGEFYTKEGADGTPTRIGSWQWKDSETKDAFYLSSIEFMLRGLNDEELIFASDQSQEPCTIIKWQQLDEPITE